jgi:hypothetical protein
MTYSGMSVADTYISTLQSHQWSRSFDLEAWIKIQNPLQWSILETDERVIALRDLRDTGGNSIDWLYKQKGY